MRDFDDRFLFAVAVAVVIIAAAVSTSSSSSSQSMRQTLPPNMIKARMKKVRARLTWYIIATDFSHVWCYWCVQRLKNDRSMMCVPSSNPRRQKCDRCSTNKHACAFDSTSLKLQMRLRRYVAILMTMPSLFHEEIFQRALREWRDK